MLMRRQKQSVQGYPHKNKAFEKMMMVQHYEIHRDYQNLELEMAGNNHF